MKRSKRSHSQEEHESSERWLVSYADFITLLFAFFTVLYATSQQDVEKAQEFEQSIRKYFGAVVGGTQSEGESPFHNRNLSAVESPFDTTRTARKANLEVESYVAQFLQKALTQQQYQQSVIEVASDSDGVRIRLSAQALFESGGAVILTQSLPILAKIGELLKRTSRPVIIEGHTDKSMPQPPYPTNWELSSVRTAKVLRFLTERLKVPEDQLSTRSYANQRSLVEESAQDARFKNARIDILISSAPIIEE